MNRVRRIRQGRGLLAQVAVTIACLVLSAACPAQATDVRPVSTGAEAWSPSISGDGRFVVYTSRSSLTDELNKVFLFDRATGATTLVSRRAGSDPPSVANGQSDYARISADGRFVVFGSEASDLVAGLADGNGRRDVFLWDRLSGTTRLVSRTPAGSPANHVSMDAQISDDGRIVVYRSYATDLGPVPLQASTPPVSHFYLYDALTDTTVLVDHRAGAPWEAGASGVGPSTNESFAFTVSGDGRFVAYTSAASNLVFGQVEPTPGNDDVFVYDRENRKNQLASHVGSSSVTAGSGPRACTDPLLSQDGAVLVFSCWPNVYAEFPDAYVYDSLSAETRLVQRGGYASSLGADGRFVIVENYRTDIIPGQVDTNRGFEVVPGQIPPGLDVFLIDLGSSAVSLVSRSVSSPLHTGNRPSYNARISADGRVVTFESGATDLTVGQDTNYDPLSNRYGSDVFRYDRTSRRIELISHKRAADHVAGNDASYNSVLSVDGRLAVFQSRASDPTEGVFSPWGNVFCHDAAGLEPDDSLLLGAASRFRVDVRWRSADGLTGQAKPYKLGVDSADFWFFGPDNVEVLVKVLNGCAISGRYWVFAAGLTSVETTVTVTDTASGGTRVYANRQGVPFRPVQDTAAFASCP